MEVQITIDWKNAQNAVKKHLSIIGKRLKSNDGSSQFAGVTLSSEEESVMKHYINAAAETFVGELSPLVSLYDSGEFLTFTVENTRWNGDGLTAPFEGNFMGYMVAYVANGILGMNYPELAKKYAEDMTNHLQAAIKLIFIKNPPKKSDKTIVDMIGEVTLEDEEEINKNEKI